MPESDSRLLYAARRGNEGAFLALYQCYRMPLFRFAWRLTGSIAAAEDVIQECFLALLDGVSFHDDQGSLRAYLFGITRNLALKRIRTAERERDEPKDHESAADLFENLLAAERSELVARAVTALPPGQREALVLFEYEELSLEEISQVMGIEIGAVKARLHRARETLRRDLRPLLATTRV